MVCQDRPVPIMHVLGIRKELVEREPWIATSVLKAFTQAKDVCLREMSDVTAGGFDALDCGGTA